jgi:multicomponent Na+:H+ antiporter subunit B
MSTVILRTTTRFLLVLLVVFSLFLLLRGHDEPGGGFVGGLVMASGLSLYGLAFGMAELRRLMRVDPRTLVGFGLLAALTAAFAGPLTGKAFLAGLWTKIVIPGIGKISSVLLFDVGVDLVVVGTVVIIVTTLAGDETT